MIDVTETLVKHLDMCRSFGMGSDAVLILLTHNSDKGYSALADPVPGGWTVELGDVDQTQVLIIIEHEFVDWVLLNKTKAFAVNGLVYEIVGGTRMIAPEREASLKEWKFRVSPTGEEF